MKAGGRLAGKRVLITGAGSGIGKACAVEMAREGAEVLATDIDRESARSTARDSGPSASFLPLDVSREGDWIGLAQRVSGGGGLDVLINNAGIGIGGDITALDLADWRRQQAVNLDGAFLGIKHMLPLIRDTGSRGAIINIASVTGIRASATFVSYAASKGGLIALTRAVARQCAAAGDGIRVNAIAPGIIDTPMFGGLEGISPEQAGQARESAETLVPLGRAGSPRDVAMAAIYLASDEAAYVTGVTLPVDGGLLTG